MAVNPIKAPSFQADQAKKALMAFYQKPVAQVSTELFFTIGAIIFFALFAIRPTIITMTELVKEIEDKEKLSDGLGKKVTTLSSVSQEYFALQDRLVFVEEVIPEDPNPQRSLKVIEKIASDNSLSITSLQLQEIPQTPDASVSFSQKEPLTLAVAATIEGEYLSIRKFIDDLVQTRPLITVESIAFTQSLDSEENQRLSANLAITLHYFGKGGKASIPGESESNPDPLVEEAL